MKEQTAEPFAPDEERGYAGDVTVYFRYRFLKDDSSYMGDLHYGHRVVKNAETLDAAIKHVMDEETASMIGHTGDRGIVEFVYATNGVDPKEDLWLWKCGEAQN